MCTPDPPPRPRDIPERPHHLHYPMEMERTIGNLKHEIWQPSIYLTNFAKEGLCRARVNALRAAIPELDDSHSALPASAVDLSDGYALLHK
jgi:hypothetical protein